MKTILITLCCFLTYSLSATSLGMCNYENDIIFPELLNDTRSTKSILLVKVDTIFQEGYNGGGFAEVLKVFKGQKIKKRIRIISENGGLTPGARTLKIGQKYVVVADSNDGYNFTAFMCDRFSFELDEGTTYKNGRNEYTRQEKAFEIIQHYFKLKKEKYSGQVILKYGDQISGKGQFEKGIPTGRWHYFRQSGVNDSIITKSMIFYKNGLPEGTVIYYDKYFGKIQKIEFHSNGELIKEEFYEPIDNDYNTIKAKEVDFYSIGNQKYKRAIHKWKGREYNYEQTYKVFPFQIANQVRDGNFIDYYPNLSVKETGQYYLGAKIGEWVTYDSIGQEINKEYFPLPDTSIADVVFFYPDGTSWFYGNLENGKQTGQWTMLWDKRQIRTWHFQNGKKQGIVGKYDLDNHPNSEKHFENDIQHGSETKYFKDGTIQRVTPFKNGKQEGEEITYKKSGAIHSKGNYQNGFKHGIFQIFKNGKTYEINYHKGLKHGTFKEPNYKSGEDEGEYYLGFKKGIWKYYDEAGTLLREEFYDFEFSNETPVWYKYYNSDGSLKEKIDFRDY